MLVCGVVRRLEDVVQTLLPYIPSPHLLFLGIPQPDRALQMARSPQYSTLELVKHDKSAAAPERDYATVAPENNRDREALQVRRSPIPI